MGGGNFETKTYNNLKSLIDTYKVKGEKDIKEDKSKQEQIKDKSQRMSDEEIKKFGFVKDLVRMNHPGRRQLPKAKEQITESQTYNLERYFDNKTKKIVYEPKSNSFYLVDYLEKDPQKKVTKILKERAFELINKDKKDSDKKKNQNETEVLIDKTETLKNAKGKRLDAIIKYSNSAKEEGIEGIKVAKDATDNEKRIAIAKFYKEAAEGDADNLDEIVEEALADYVPEEKD